jgi:hypothetical protein
MSTHTFSILFSTNHLLKIAARKTQLSLNSNEWSVFSVDHGMGSAGNPELVSSSRAAGSGLG